MTYYVVLCFPDAPALTLVSHNSVDYLVSKFLKTCVDRIHRLHKGNYKLLACEARYLIMDRNDESHGMMVWVVAENHKNPILMVSLKNRNTLTMYDVKGRMVGRDSLV